MLTSDQIAIYRKDMYVAQRDHEIEVEPKRSMVYKMVPSGTGGGDKETQLLGAGRLERHTTEGQDIKFKSPVQGWTTLVKFHTFSAGLALTKEAVEDVVKGPQLLRDLASGWTKYVTIAKEELAVRPFNKGGDTTPGDGVFDGTWPAETDSSAGLLYDSIPWFALTGAPHTTKGGGTYYNSVASLTVTAGNFETLYNLQKATNNRDEEDEVVGNPCDAAICTPGSNAFLLDRIIDTSKGLPNSQLNDKNPYYGIIKKIIDWDYLASTAGYFIGKMNHKSVCFCDRQNQELDFYRHRPNKGYRASIDARFGVWFKALAWKAWVRGGGTSSAGSYPTW